MQQNIALGDRAIVVIAAHVEVRSVLRSSGELLAHGLDDVLIGSYARRVMNWPGKDVDVFGRLLDESVNSMGPDDAYEAFGRALQPFAAQGRLTPQPRSFKIRFSPEQTPSAESIRTAAKDYRWGSARVANVLANLKRLAFDFSVDVVPAVSWDGHYGIPETEHNIRTGTWSRTGRWRRTDPVELTALTRARNRDPRIAGVGAFIRTIKAIRQAKAHHLPGAKPSALFYEFLLHEGSADGSIRGDSWADITAGALSFVAGRLATTGSQPVCDPGLGEPYSPVPSAADLDAARLVFEGLARRGRRAVTTDHRCQAAIEWRGILGGNERADHVFPLPPGCRGTGAAMGAATANIASGGTGERGFGAF